MSRIGQRLAEVLNAIPQGNGEYAARCPICGDSKRDLNKRRFHINVEHDKFVCFNGGCPAKGRKKEIIELLHKLDGKIDPRDLINTDNPQPRILNPQPEEKVKERILSKEAQGLLKRAVPYNRFPPLIKRLVLRDLLPRCIFTYDEIKQLYAVPKLIRKNWDWRVIIPVTENIFQGKSLKGEDPKYLAPPELDWFIDDDIPNSKECSVEGPVIVAEGILDYHSLPRGNRSLTGGDKRFYNSRMLEYVKNYDEVIYALDSDLAGYIVITQLYPYRNSLRHLRIFYPHLADPKQKDLNDLLAKSETVQSKDELRSLVIREAVTIKQAYLHIIGEKIEWAYDQEKRKSKWALKTFNPTTTR